MGRDNPSVTKAVIELELSDGTRERHTFFGADLATFQTQRAEPHHQFYKSGYGSYFMTTPGKIKHIQFSLQNVVENSDGQVWLTEDLNVTEPLDICQAETLF